jgi:cephalosporin-C deacetylase-like acetyl esterase
VQDEFLQMPVIVEFDGKQERVELPQVKNGDYFKKVSKYFKIADLSTFKINQELEYIDVVEVAAFKEKKEMKIKK